MRVQLIIKGSFNDAANEANRYGIDLLSVRSHYYDDRTVVECDSDANTLNGWFTRDTAVDDNGDFPTGSLLYWAPINESQK